MIIDCHVHAGKGDGLTGPWNSDTPIEPYLVRARAAGIDKAVVFTPFHSDYARANAEVARIVARYPNELIGFAFVHPARDKGRVGRMVEQAVFEWGFRGIKAHRHDAPLTPEICEVARVFRLPVLYDIGGQTNIVEMVAAQYPDVNFIIPHLGAFADSNWKAHVQLIDQLVRFPNVYADTSSVLRFDYLAQAVKRAGAHKILFGSDGPWLHPGLELYKIRLLHLPSRDEALVLGGNLLRLISQVEQ